MGPVLDSTGAAPTGRDEIGQAHVGATLEEVPTAAGSGGAEGQWCEDDGDAERSVSIGDRIEGIRACLEARMGTQRFQKLYRSLSGDDRLAVELASAHFPGTADSLAAAAALVWPRDSSMVLPEEIDEAFDGAGEGESADLESLVPLVAKLVACENSYFS